MNRVLPSPPGNDCVNALALYPMLLHLYVYVQSRLSFRTMALVRLGLVSADGRSSPAGSRCPWSTSLLTFRSDCPVRGFPDFFRDFNSALFLFDELIYVYGGDLLCLLHALYCLVQYHVTVGAQYSEIVLAAVHTIHVFVVDYKSVEVLVVSTYIT